MRGNVYVGVEVKPVNPSAMNGFCKKVEIRDLQVLD